MRAFVSSFKMREQKDREEDQGRGWMLKNKIGFMYGTKIEI
jgi:hypothetical protein